VIRASESESNLPVVQQGIQRVYDEASTYYRNLRWDKNRLTRFETVSYTHLTLPTICSV